MAALELAIGTTSDILRANGVKPWKALAAVLALLGCCCCYCCIRCYICFRRCCGGRGWQKVDEQRRSIGVADEADEMIDAPLTFHVAAPPPLPKPRPRPAERAAARVGVFKAAPPLPAVIRAAQRTGGGAAAGSDDESAVCFAPRQRMTPPPPKDSRSDPRSRSPDNDVL